MAFLKFRPLTSRFNFIATIDEKDINSNLLQYLLDNETIFLAFKSGRDVGIFTDKRILLLDIKGIRGLRKNIFSLKYDSISSCELNISFFDSLINLTTDSGYKIALNFLKPILLDDMVKVYQLINSQLLS